MKENILSKILVSSSIILLGTLFGKIIGIVNQGLLGRLGPETFGFLTLIITSIKISTIIILFGTRSGIVRYISIYFNNNDIKGQSSLIFQSFIFNIFFGISVSILYYYVFNYFFPQKLSKNILLLIVLIIPLHSFYPLLLGIIRGFGNSIFKVLADKFIIKISRAILIVYLIYYLNMHIEGALIAILVSIICSTLFLIFIINNKFISFRKIFFTKKRNEIIGLLQYSWPLAFSAYILLLFNYIDIFSLSYFKTNSDIGIYKAALVISAFIGVLPHSLTYMFFPSISTIVNNNNQEDVKKTFSSIVKISFCLSVLGMFFIISNGNLLINLIYGTEYFESYQLLIFLGLAQCIVYATGPTGSMLNALGKTKEIMICNISSGTINLILNVPFVLYLGVIGVAISTAISLIIRNLMTLFYIKKYLGYLPFNTKYLFVSILPLVTIFITYYLTINYSISSISLFFISVLLGLLSVYLFHKINFFNIDEINTFKIFYNKIIHKTNN